MVEEAQSLAAIRLRLLKLREGTPRYDPSNLDADDLALLAALDYELPTGGSAVENEITRIETRVGDLESFFNQIIEYQRAYGIPTPRVSQ
jgi:hypothetical protein